MSTTTFTNKTISSPSTSLFKDRGSKFIGFAYPINNRDDIKEPISILKKEHPKAVHFCYAYRVGTEGLDYRTNDDGEPSGSAGKPIMGQIDSSGITNVLIVVVRYFGGTLLGVPGLINAYKSAAFECLQSAEIIEKIVTKKLIVSYEYSLMGELMNIIKHNDLNILSQQMNLFCRMKIEVPLEKFDLIKEHLLKMRLEVIEG